MSYRMNEGPTPSKRFPTEESRVELAIAIAGADGRPHGHTNYIRDLIVDLHGRIEELESQVKYLTSEDRFNKGLPG